jgi:hypothetical protein
MQTPILFKSTVEIYKFTEINHFIFYLEQNMALWTHCPNGFKLRLLYIAFPNIPDGYMLLINKTIKECYLSNRSIFGWCDVRRPLSYQETVFSLKNVPSLSKIHVFPLIYYYNTNKSILCIGFFDYTRTLYEEVKRR